MNYDEYIKILTSEMQIAMGCTEPLAVAYAGSVAANALGAEPVKVTLIASSNIIKNVRCVNVPNSVDFNGIKAAVLLGIFAGDHTKGFGCINIISEEAKLKAKKFIEDKRIEVENSTSKEKLHIIVKVFSEEHSSIVEIAQSHLNVVKIVYDNKVIFKKDFVSEDDVLNYSSEALSFDNIIEFANTVDLSKVNSILDPEYTYNLDIAQCGINGSYGLKIGETILKTNNTLDGKIIAYTAAASEARMCGCVKPVVINSGSGNQGLSSSVPVIIYGLENGISKDRIYRALLLSNLLTVKQKYKIGALSAFCGVVSSCCSAGAAITYLANGTNEQIKMTISNHLATVTGMICDGAKASCAAKIAASLQAALMSHHLAMNNYSYHDGEGILQDTIDDTIAAVAEIGSKGMIETDEEIMKILLGSER